MPEFQRKNTRASKLTYDQVADIRARYAAGKSQGALAREYKMSAVQIGRIVRMESWTDVPAAPATKAELHASALRLLALQHEVSGTAKLQAVAAEELKGKALLDELDESTGGRDAGYAED